VFYERTSRPAELHHAAWLNGQIRKATQGLDALDREVATFGAEVYNRTTTPRPCWPKIERFQMDDV
jgi:hypothetical protein